MSLREAYLLAHTAQCRLQMEANRPDRNLRFVVGHLMHYESLRLRIVNIEHDISQSERATKVQYQDHRLQHEPSTRQPGRPSPPPPAYPEHDDVDDIDDLPEDDEEDTAGLSLERFPSGSTRPPIAPPDLEPDNPDSDPDSEDEDEPVSPEEPSADEIERCLRSKNNDTYATMYEGVRKCPCHGNQDAPSIDKFWDLPPDRAHSKDGVTRVLAQVSDANATRTRVAA